MPIPTTKKINNALGTVPAVELRAWALEVIAHTDPDTGDWVSHAPAEDD